MKRLIDSGLSVNGPTIKRTPFPPLPDAINDERAEIVDYLLERGADVNVPAHTSALTWAAQRGNTLMVRKLLALGADVNGGRNAGKTPLMAAATRRSVEITKLLLEAGADVNRKGLYGKSALSEALWGTEMHGPNPVVPILRAAGATE